MPAFHPEPQWQHGSAHKTGVLLINLGTPAAPTATAVRPYLQQFLSDPRVVDMPRWLWKIILHGIILRTRPRKSAAKYASIWQKKGSPLLLHTAELAHQLQQRLHGQVMVEFAMRYGEPSIASRLHQLKAQGCQQILLLPLYPQYASSSSGSALDECWRVLRQYRHVPDIRTLRHYHDHPAYIEALAQTVRQHWTQYGQGDVLLMSFHGVPKATLEQGDPYFCECHKTARLLAQTLELAPDRWQLAFQSRFGRAEWVKPYTHETLKQLGKRKLARLDVICPAFATDCLETLEEIAQEGKETFTQAGGGEFRYIACLNSQAAHLALLETLVLDHTQGWLTAPDAVALTLSRQRALEIGATR